MNKILFLSFYLFFNLISYSQANSKIELFDLVKMFIPQKENTYKDWFTGAEDGSPIDWKTEGANYEDEYSINLKLGSFGRIGNTIVTINGEPLYVLAKKKEMVKWDIKIFGPRVGISSLHISNNLLGNFNCSEDDCVKSYFSKKGATIKLLYCNIESVSSGKRFYEIKIKNKPKVFLTEEFSCGSAGCSSVFLFQFYKPDNEYLEKQGLSKCK